MGEGSTISIFLSIYLCRYIRVGEGQRAAVQDGGEDEGGDGERDHHTRPTDAGLHTLRGGRTGTGEFG